MDISNSYQDVKWQKKGNKYLFPNPPNKISVISHFDDKNLKVGDVLEVGTPEGKFTFEPQSDRQRNYAAFVAGSGITPALSILKSVLESDPQSSFVLVYGNKSAAETISLQD